MSDACIQHLHTHRWPYWHDLRGGRTEPEDLVGGDTQSGPGSDLASQAGRRRSCWPASAARERSQPSGAGAGIGSGGGELLRGRLRRILAASAVDRGWDYEFCFRSGQHCGGAAQPAGEDGPPRRRAVAAHADGALPRRAAGGADRAGAEPRAGGRPPRQPGAPAAGQGTDRSHQPDQGAAPAVGNGGGGNPRRRDWLTWLARQRDWEGQPVPPRLVAELKREHARLLVVCEQLQALSKAPAPRDVPMAAARMAEHKANLRRLKSLGPAFAGTLTDEVFYKDFDNGRQVASYVGLAPSPWRSGGTNREQGISKAGNPRARHQAIELAWLWLRHQPDSALSREFLRRTAGASSRIRRIAIVALARKLMVALWRYLTTGLLPEGAVVKA